MLKTINVSAAGIIPEGSTFTIHDTKMTGLGEWPQERVIRLANAELSKLWVGGTLMTEVGSTGGNRALGEVQNEVREDIRDDDIAAESETITDQLIRPIVANSKYNGRLDLLPTFRRVVPEPVDDKADAELLTTAINDWGMKVPASYARERFGIPIVEDEMDEEAALPGRSSGSAFDPLQVDPTIEVANSDRSPCGVTVKAHRALETITKRRRSSASRLASWLFAAVAVSMAHTENVIGAVSDFVARRRDLPTALEDLPDVFDRLPTDEMAALQEQFILASRMSGMLMTQSKIAQRANKSFIATHSDRLVVPHAEFNFNKIPFVEAIDALRDRLTLNPVEFERLEAEARSRAFRVAAVWDMNLLSQIHGELVSSIEAGETTRDLQQRLPQMADRNGWSGENPWHADLVQFTGFVTSHGAGRYEQYDEFGIERWQFVANGDSCPICTPVVGKIFRLSDRRYFPPLHFWCDCEDEAVFEDEHPGEFDDSARFDHPAYEKYVAKPSAFRWDPASYAKIEPLNLSAIVPSLQPRFRAVAEKFNWEVIE